MIKIWTKKLGTSALLVLVIGVVLISGCTTYENKESTETPKNIADIESENQNAPSNEEEPTDNDYYISSSGVPLAKNCDVLCRDIREKSSVEENIEFSLSKCLSACESAMEKCTQETEEIDQHPEKLPPGMTKEEFKYSCIAMNTLQLLSEEQP